MTTEETAENGGGRGLRSPGYPACSLPTAITKAKVLKDYSPGRKPIPIDSTLKVLGYSPRSGGGLQLVAAIKKYGLIEDAGSLDTRSVRLTDLGWSILVDTRPVSPDRDASIQRAALLPKINAEIRERWPHGLPDTTTLHHWLAAEKQFNEKAIPSFVRDLEETFQYAKLDSEPNPAKDTGGDPKAGEVKSGDHVQWVSQGSAQFAEPRKVLGVSEDGTFAFVEGTATGVPVSQLTVEPAPKSQPSGQNPPRNPFALADPIPAGMEEATFPLDEGRVVLRWPAKLSGSSLEEFEDWIKLVLKKAKRTATDAE